MKLSYFFFLVHFHKYILNYSTTVHQIGQNKSNVKYLIQAHALHKTCNDDVTLLTKYSINITLYFALKS